MKPLFFTILLGFITFLPAQELKPLLQQQLEGTYFKQEWFVPLKKAIDGLTLEQINWKNRSDNNSIANLVSHLLFWNERQLIAFKGGSLPEFNGDNNVTFRKFKAADWKSTLTKLDSVQLLWKQALDEADIETLNEWQQELLHMCNHMAYHTGQIVYIRKENGWWEQGSTTKLEKIPLNRFKRLYKLNNEVYRSEQPSKKGFKDLAELGIKTSINFRRNKNDRVKAKGTGLNLVHIPLKTSELTEAHLIKALSAINSAEKPVLVHCWHGSDRTGAIMAAYRVVFENWSKEDAISELRKPELGYHENWYPNVVDLISNLNPNEIRESLGL